MQHIASDIGNDWLKSLLNNDGEEDPVPENEHPVEPEMRKDIVDQAGPSPETPVLATLVTTSPPRRFRRRALCLAIMLAGVSGVLLAGAIWFWKPRTDSFAAVTPPSPTTAPNSTDVPAKPAETPNTNSQGQPLGEAKPDVPGESTNPQEPAHPQDVPQATPDHAAQQSIPTEPAANPTTPMPVHTNAGAEQPSGGESSPPVPGDAPPMLPVDVPQELAPPALPPTEPAVPPAIQMPDVQTSLPTEPIGSAAGITLYNVSAEKLNGLGLRLGALVATAPAAKAGEAGRVLQADDVITKVGDLDIRCADDLWHALAAVKPGETVTLEVDRYPRLWLRSQLGLPATQPDEEAQRRRNSILWRYLGLGQDAAISLSVTLRRE